MKASSRFFEKNPDDATFQNQFNLTLGTDSKFTSNFYEILISDVIKSSLKVYNVTISPEVRNEELACKIVYSSTCPDEGDRKDSPTWNSMVFNGRDMIISKKPISATPCVIEGSSYNVVLSEARECSEQDLKFLYFRVIENALIKLGYQQYESGWLKSHPDKIVQHLKLYYVFNTHIQSIDGKIAIIIDIQPVVMRNTTLSDVLKNQHDRDKIDEVIKKLTFATNYGHKRNVQISKIIWNSPPLIHYNQKDVSIAEFYKFKYDITIDESQPFAEIRVKRNNQNSVDYIPSSLLMQIGVLDNEKFNKSLMRDLQRYAQIQPIDIHKIGKSFLDEFADAQLLKDFGISIGSQITFDGRVISPPFLKFRSSNQDSEFVDVQINNRCSVKNELNKNQIVLPPIITTSPLIICEKKSEKVSIELKNQIIKIMSKLGVNILPPDFTFSDGPSFTTAISQAIAHAGVPSFIICVLPDGNSQLYSTLKIFLTSSLGIPSSFVTDESLVANKQSMDQIATDMCLSIICKTGGVPFYVSPVSLPLRNTVFAGFEVSQTNVAAVASYDNTFARYLCKTESTTDVPAFFGNFFYNLNAERIVAFTSLSPRDVRKIVDKIGSVCKSLTVISASRKDGVVLLTDTERPQPAMAGSCVSINGSLFISCVSSGKDNARPTMYTVAYHYPRIWTDDQLAAMIHYLSVAYPISLESATMPTPLKFARKAMKSCKRATCGKKINDNIEKFAYYL